MRDSEELWERVVSLPPGPELAAALASVTLSAVPNDRMVDVLRAQSRQLAHQQARMLATLVEVSRTTPGVAGVGRADGRFEWATGEIAAALTWTTRAADRELGFAEIVVCHLPRVFESLCAGHIDRAKAWVFADHLDPAGCGLSSDQVLALCGEFVPLAPALTTAQLAARLIRAILALDPDHARRRYAKAVRERQVIAYLDRHGTVTVAGTGLPAAEAAEAIQRLENLASAVKRAGHPGRLGRIQADLFCGLLSGRYHQLTQDEIISDLVGRAGGERGDGPDPARTGARVGVEIRVGLTTLLGMDDEPGEIPGLGPVLADVARDLVLTQTRGAAWRFAVTDAARHLCLAGSLRRRPSGSGSERCSGGVVEIHVPAALLPRLVDKPDAHGPWAGVIAEIARQYRRRRRLLADLDGAPVGRHANAALVRHIQIRDRTCSHPGCLRPARKSDLDHTEAYTRGGPTNRYNLGPVCDRHHLYKHELGWKLRQGSPGHFEWISPLGRIYHTRGEPISPPRPRRRRQARKRRPRPNRPPPKPPSPPPSDEPPR